MSIVIVILSFITGFVVGCLFLKNRYKKPLTIVISDVYKGNFTTEKDLRNKCVMQLSNEITSSGALRINKTDDGYEAQLTLLK